MKMASVPLAESLEWNTVWGPRVYTPCWKSVAGIYLCLLFITRTCARCCKASGVFFSRALSFLQENFMWKLLFLSVSNESVSLYQFKRSSHSSFYSWVVQEFPGCLPNQSSVLFQMLLRRKSWCLISLLLLLLLLAIERSLLKMGLNRCGSTAVGWSLLIQIFPGHCCHIELQYGNSTVPHSAIVLFCPETMLDYVQRSHQYHPEVLPIIDFSWQSLWPFCGALVFGPESCFSQCKFILLDSFISLTARPSSMPLWYILYQQDSSTLNFEKRDRRSWNFIFFSCPKKLKPLHTNSFTSF